MNRKITIIISIALVAFVGILVLTMMKDANQVSFSATVLENNQTSILVEPFEGEDELRSSDKIVVRVPGASNQLEDLSEFRPGSKVKITYDGMIMESYPAQINAYKIEKIN